MNTQMLSGVGLSLLLLLTGCSDSGVNAVVGTFSPAGTVVYLADQDIDGVFELYLTSTGGKLNPALPADRDVVSFALTPDKTAVLYIADQTVNDVFELYRVNIATPGQSVKLNGTLQAGGDVVSFAVTPDGSSVVYLADQSIDPGNELYRVVFSNQGSGGIRLTPTFSTGGTIVRFALTPDSTRVVYIADQTTANVNELYQVAFSSPQTSNKLNTPLGVGRNVTEFVVSPNSASVVYLADQTTDQVFEIYFAQASPSVANGIRLNPALPPGQNVTTFAVTPDSAAVIYRADETTAGVFQLYRVSFATPAPGANPPLNGALIAGGNVSTAFAIAPNGAAVVYRADQNTLGVEELYLVALSPVGAAQKLNPNYVGGQSISGFAVTPDSSAVIYMANQSSSAIQLYRVPFSTPQQSSAQLNGSLAAGGNVASFSIVSNNTNILYRADQSTFGIGELYSTNVTTPGTSSKLNGQLVVPGGNVVDFTF